MAPELQRIAIAKVRGWLPNPSDWDKSVGYDETEINWLKPLGKRAVSSEPLPDYLNDLNAMHEAEKSVKNFHRYGNILSKVVLGFTGEPETITLNYWALTRIAGATAAQRAEAFLRTLNLWTDSL